MSIVMRSNEKTFDLRVLNIRLIVYTEFPPPPHLSQRQHEGLAGPLDVGFIPSFCPFSFNLANKKKKRTVDFLSGASLVPEHVIRFTLQTNLQGSIARSKGLKAKEQKARENK